MLLSKVEYELFEFEDPTEYPPVLARQIRLSFSDAPTLFVSWTWERQHGPDDPGYTIGYAQASYCKDDPQLVVDASDSPLWTNLVHHIVQLEHIESSSPQLQYQALVLRSESHATYMYSLDMDRISVSERLPSCWFS